MVSARPGTFHMNDTAIVIGAGPAGLTAAYELLTRTDTRVIVLERSDFIGGISRTVDYKGNRMDIGGHRFFSKSDRVMNWWQEMMPLESSEAESESPESDRLALPRAGELLRMLKRQRISRIYYLRRFFDYPVKLNANTIKNLGPARIAKMGMAYLQARAFPRPDESTLEDFFINRFGTELYRTFFKHYTEKVWGVDCRQISSEWGGQRIKGLSVMSALKHAILAPLKRSQGSIAQKNVETSLIERFLYPKLGPGQLWEEVARRIQERGAKLVLKCRVTGLAQRPDGTQEVTAVNEETGEVVRFEGKYVFSTMPVDELIAAMGENVPADVRRVAGGLCYRDFVTAGLLVRRLKLKNETKIPTRNGLVPDNWIYIQETSVKLGRLQLFQNWSPYMIKDLDQVWLGLEYFCNRGDALWSMADDEFLRFAASELDSIGVIDSADVIDGTVIRVEKTYPAYFGTYGEFAVIRDYTDSIENLFLVGRNGMHRYNNADHSMLTAMTAVDNIVANRKDKKNIWDVNTEQEYHEEK
jgi:protoporphyrinogen oxidase